ncbi:hypothetical protein [Brevundimonas sp.]|uniref:hypothetical protein n=1 Tax=Brevundimonas sp. TaxID=1871086 RepID=UPI0025E38EE0|nr:hypothetical protein [Brevundimonas sp.]
MRTAILILGCCMVVAACGGGDGSGTDQQAPATRASGDGCRIEGRWIISGPSGEFAYVADAQGNISRPEYIGTTGTASLDEQSLLIQADDHPLNVTIRAELAPDCLTGEGVGTAVTTDPSLAEGGEWRLTVRHECTEMIDGREVLAAC